MKIYDKLMFFDLNILLKVHYINGQRPWELNYWGREILKYLWIFDITQYVKLP